MTFEIRHVYSGELVATCKGDYIQPRTIGFAIYRRRKWYQFDECVGIWETLIVSCINVNEEAADFAKQLGIKL
jgi:hypothetical protein